MAMAGLYVGTSSSLPRANPGCNQQISVHTAVALFPAGGTAIHPAIPWWLWWNILSADAPMVAVLWAALLSHASGSRLHVVDGTILFLAVWLIYIGDRLLDGWTAKNRAVLRERHRYCEGHRTILAGLLGVACIAIFLLTFGYLPSGEINAGVKLGALLIAYMMSIHIGRARLASLLPKELVVGSGQRATHPSLCLGQECQWSRSSMSTWTSPTNMRSSFQVSPSKPTLRCLRRKLRPPSAAKTYCAVIL